MSLDNVSLYTPGQMILSESDLIPQNDGNETGFETCFKRLVSDGVQHEIKAEPKTASAKQAPSRTNQSARVPTKDHATKDVEAHVFGYQHDAQSKIDKEASDRQEHPVLQVAGVAEARATQEDPEEKLADMPLWYMAGAYLTPVPLQPQAYEATSGDEEVRLSLEEVEIQPAMPQAMAPVVTDVRLLVEHAQMSVALNNLDGVEQGLETVDIQPILEKAQSDVPPKQALEVQENHLAAFESIDIDMDGVEDVRAHLAQAQLTQHKMLPFVESMVFEQDVHPDIKFEFKPDVPSDLESEGVDAVDVLERSHSEQGTTDETKQQQSATSISTLVSRALKAYAGPRTEQAVQGSEAEQILEDLDTEDTFGHLALNGSEESVQEPLPAAPQDATATMQAAFLQARPIADQGVHFSEKMDSVAQTKDIQTELLEGKQIGLEQLNRELVSQLHQGARRIHLRVAPPNIGALDIEVQIQNRQVHLSMRGESADLQQHMQENMHDLARQLRAQGLDLGNTQFSSGSADHSQEQREGTFKARRERGSSKSVNISHANTNHPQITQKNSSMIHVVL